MNRAILAATLMVLAGPAAAQAPAAPGSDSEILGPDGSFRIKLDGVEWARIPGDRWLGMRCTEKACGQDLVFCVIQVRVDKDARAGEPTSVEIAGEFGAGVLKHPPKNMTSDYVTRFAEKSFGSNLGQWAEVKTEGARGSLRLGLFVTKAQGQIVAFNCASPTAKWDENKPRFETLLATLRITK